MKDVPFDIQGPGSDLVVCPHYRIGDQVIRTVGSVAQFGTASEVTLDKLRVEIVFPRDDEAEAFFKQNSAVVVGATYLQDIIVALSRRATRSRRMASASKRRS